LTGEILKILDPVRNPAFRFAQQALWIARDPAGKALGRIAATWDPRHEESLGEKAGWFGFFDAADAETTRFLVGIAWSWLEEQGARTMLGPADPDTNHPCGCLIEGHEELPYLLMPHNPPEYGPWLEAAGLHKACDLLAYESGPERSAKALKRMSAVQRRVLQRGGITLQPGSKKDFCAFVDAAHEVYNEAWKENWGFLPMTIEEFRYLGRELKILVDPGMSFVARHRGEPVGFLLTLPDPNPALKAVNSRLLPFGFLKLPFLMKKVDRFRVVALGVKKAFHNRGIESAMIFQAVEYAFSNGFEKGEMSWTLEDNEPMLKIIRLFRGRLSRRYRLFRYPPDGHLPG